MVLLICRYSLRWYRGNKYESTVVLVVVFISILYQARQGKEGKEWEGRQSEKEGSKLSWGKWNGFLVFATTVSARFSSRIVCIWGHTFAAKAVSRRTNYVLLWFCVQKDAQLLIVCFGEWPNRSWLIRSHVLASCGVSPWASVLVSAHVACSNTLWSARYFVSA